MNTVEAASEHFVQVFLHVWVRSRFVAFVFSDGDGVFDQASTKVEQNASDTRDPPVCLLQGVELFNLRLLWMVVHR